MARGSVEALPTGTVTFLFTDIEGSTPLWDAHPAAMRVALARHDDIVTKAIAGAGGHVFSTGGDGFGAVFERVGNAVAAALAAQRTLRTEPWPEHVELRVRMGMHTGEVDEREGDYFGAAVNRAARLMGAAHGGQVVMSALSAELLDDSVGVELIDLGFVQLKGVVDPVHVFGATEPGVDWIDRELIAAQTTAGNLPRPQTDLVGDLADLQRRVSTLGRARLVTLTGSGGVGKTRAAIEIGWLVLDEFPDGVWMIELAPITDPDAVMAATASVLRAQPQPGVSVLDSIVTWCHRRRILLIIDNCEHVLAQAVELVSAINAGCENVTIVATSREPLRVDGERVIRIPSLEQHHGVELFCARAQAADDSFVPSPHDRATIATICDRLDGIPLAIELAAARTRSLSPAELLQRLDDRFHLLRASGPGHLERHQTLRATVTWSYQLLSPQHRLLFDRLSVFAGGFTLDAAQSVCAGGVVEVDDIIDLIGELVDKSMVTSQRSGSTTRYRLLETLRQYGEERLDERGETAAVRDRHLAHYRDIAFGIDAQWWSPAQLDADATCDEEWDNFRAAHGWAITTGAFQQAADILDGASPHYSTRLRFEVSGWTIRTLELGERQHVSRSIVFVGIAYWSMLVGDFERTERFAELGIKFADDEKSMALSQQWRVYAAMFCGRFEEVAALVPEIRDCLAKTRQPAYRLFLTQLLIDMLLTGGRAVDDEVESLRAIARQIGAPTMLASAQGYYGNMLLDRQPPDVDGAVAAYRDAIAAAMAGNAPLTELGTRLDLVVALVLHRRNDEASEAIHVAMTRSIETWYVLPLYGTIESCAVHFSNIGQLEAAAVILGFVASSPSGSRASIECRRRVEEAIAAMDDHDSSMAAGAAMDLDEIVNYVFAQLDVA